MLRYVDSPFGWIELYHVAINIGIVFTLIVQCILILKFFKKLKYILFLPGYFLLLYVGRYAAAFIRCANDGGLDGVMDLSNAVLKLLGTHFLGHVITFFILYFPMLWFIRELCIEIAGVSMCSNQELVKFGEITAIGLPIQHIFNRLGCLCQGCCYGIRYDGPFAIFLPYNEDIDYEVFPCQILEILCMIILLLIVYILIRKGKHTFGLILIGFSLTFFISEFFTENPNSIRHLGLTYVQFFSIGTVIIGIGYCVILEKLLKRNQDQSNNGEYTYE